MATSAGCSPPSSRDTASRSAPWRRRIERLPDLGGAELALAGYDEPDTLEDALEPGDRVFMVSMHEPPERRIALHRGFIEVAVRRRAGRIVYLSFVGAGPDATVAHARSHGVTEAMLADSVFRTPPRSIVTRCRLPTPVSLRTAPRGLMWVMGTRGWGPAHGASRPSRSSPIPPGIGEQ